MPISHNKKKDAEFKLEVEKEQNSGVEQAFHSMQGKISPISPCRSFTSRLSLLVRGGKMIKILFKMVLAKAIQYL